MIIQTDHAPDARQLDIIAHQLGRAPHGIQAVSAEDRQGTPLVLRMHSLIDDKPFPTLYWLCSDRLKVTLSHLEAAGVIKHLEDTLRDNPDFMARYRASHEDYVRQRWAFMPDTQRDDVRRLGFEDILTHRGVGGITNWSQVRCLHTQYAHHLCGHNVIGQWVDEHYPDVAASISP